MTTFTQDDAKRAAAEAALKYIPEGEPVGIGTGSTVNFLIDALASHSLRWSLPGAVSSSEASTARLKKAGIAILDLNKTGPLSVYIDGADEADASLHLIKGGGAALTREKIVAAAARVFVCVVDESKLVPVLGRFPLPVEVIPMAQSLVGRKLAGLGGKPVLRDGVVTDNGNVIIDVHHLSITDPIGLEASINAIPGVVTVGLFAARGADRLVIGGPAGVRELLPKA